VSVPISIDTVKPAVARAALQAGASIVNDIAANRGDDEMGRLVAETGAGYVVMHMRGTPQTMQRRPEYGDVVEEVGGFFVERMEHLRALGVGPEQIILDVGLGFGKTTQHNLQLLAALNRFTRWNRPVLLGASRKSFIKQVAVAAGTNERLPGSVACACWGVAAGASIVRTHDVAATRQAVRLTEAIAAQRK
jgi:dihydropteroate synthase